MALASGDSFSSPAIGSTGLPDLHELIRASAVPQETKDGWQLLAKRGDSKSPEPVVGLRLLRSIFKQDHPYRTILTAQGNLTSTSGTLNYQLPCSNITVVSEWSSINSLFDEFFIHSMRLVYRPANQFGSSGFATTMGIESNSATTAGTTVATSGGIIMVSLFSTPAYFSAAAGMGNNPSKKLASTALPWTYYWRNNVRFDPRGVALNSSVSNGWQGWSYIAEGSVYGGAIQIRAINDLSFNGGTSMTHGTWLQEFDVSFRVRA